MGLIDKWAGTGPPQPTSGYAFADLNFSLPSICLPGATPVCKHPFLKAHAVLGCFPLTVILASCKSYQTSNHVQNYKHSNSSRPQIPRMPLECHMRMWSVAPEESLWGWSWMTNVFDNHNQLFFSLFLILQSAFSVQPILFWFGIIFCYAVDNIFPVLSVWVSV